MDRNYVASSSIYHKHSHISSSQSLAMSCVSVNFSFLVFCSFTNCLSEPELLMRWRRYLLLLSLLLYSIQAHNNKNMSIRRIIKKNFMFMTTTCHNCHHHKIVWGWGLFHSHSLCDKISSFYFSISCCKWSLSCTFSFYVWQKGDDCGGLCHYCSVERNFLQ